MRVGNVTPPWGTVTSSYGMPYASKPDVAEYEESPDGARTKILLLTLLPPTAAFTIVAVPRRAAVPRVRMNDMPGKATARWCTEESNE